MMLDRAMAMLALVVLAGFLGVVMIRVVRLDLGVVIGICFVMACYDLWRQLRPRRR